jgi:hypothetical protein
MDWEGPHIQSGKSWAEVGTSKPADLPEEGEEKDAAGAGRKEASA